MNDILRSTRSAHITYAACPPQTPKQVQTSDDVRCIDAELCALEASLNLSRRLCMIPWIETARGVLNAAEICGASPRVAAVAFGAEDFARDMQLPHEVQRCARVCACVRA